MITIDTGRLSGLVEYELRRLQAPRTTRVQLASPPPTKPRPPLPPRSPGLVASMRREALALMDAMIETQLFFDAAGAVTARFVGTRYSVKFEETEIAPRGQIAVAGLHNHPLERGYMFPMHNGDIIVGAQCPNVVLFSVAVLTPERRPVLDSVGRPPGGWPPLEQLREWQNAADEGPRQPTAAQLIKQVTLMAPATKEIILNRIYASFTPAEIYKAVRRQTLNFQDLVGFSYGAERLDVTRRAPTPRQRQPSGGGAWASVAVLGGAVVLLWAFSK